jgi:hypothetical protein
MTEITDHAAHGRRPTAAAGTDEAIDGASGDIERYIIQGRDMPKPFEQVLHLYH